MMASLTLVPISKEECYKLLQAKGKTPEPLASSSPADAERAAAAKEALGAPRNKITLKLCASSDDVIDVDDDSIESIELCGTLQSIKMEASWQLYLWEGIIVPESNGSSLAGDCAMSR